MVIETIFNDFMLIMSKQPYGQFSFNYLRIGFKYCNDYIEPLNAVIWNMLHQVNPTLISYFRLKQTAENLFLTRAFERYSTFGFLSMYKFISSFLFRAAYHSMSYTAVILDMWLHGSLWVYNYYKSVRDAVTEVEHIS